MNRKRIKIYRGNAESVQEVVESNYVYEVLLIKRLVSCRDVKSSASWEATHDVQYLQFGSFLCLFVFCIPLNKCFIFVLVLYRHIICFEPKKISRPKSGPRRDRHR